MTEPTTNIEAEDVIKTSETGVHPALAKLQEAYRDASEEVKPILSQLLGSIEESLKGIREKYKVGSLFELMQKNPAEFRAAVTQHLTDVGNAIKVAIQETGKLPDGKGAEAVEELIHLSGTYAHSLITDMQTQATAFLKTVTDPAELKKLQESMSKSLEDLSKAVDKYTKDFSKALEGFVKEFGEQPAVKAALEKGQEIVKKSGEKLGEFFTGVRKAFGLEERTPMQKFFKHVGDHKLPYGLAAVAAGVVAAIAFGGGKHTEKEMERRSADQQEPAMATAAAR